tara:strand:+ start:361 stop:927 length:567 start_codon:yes stop_codon:yes gene_type:complete
LAYLLHSIFLFVAEKLKGIEMNVSFKVSNGTQLNAGLKPQRMDADLIHKLKSSIEKFTTDINVPKETSFAEVKVGENVIAKISNSGFVTSSNEMGYKIRDILNDGDLQGPELAAQRAEQIAKAFGGKVVKSSSAQTQLQWQNRSLVSDSVKIETSELTGQMFVDLYQALQSYNDTLNNTVELSDVNRK